MGNAFLLISFASLHYFFSVINIYFQRRPKKREKGTIFSTACDQTLKEQSPKKYLDTSNMFFLQNSVLNTVKLTILKTVSFTPT